MSLNTFCIFGTRPEAIKMAPVIKQLALNHNFNNKVCVTGQHLDLLDPVMDLFKICPDYNLAVMTNNQSLSYLTGNILSRLTNILEQDHPDLVIVHGDTTTTLAASLSAYYHQIPVAHVEAGLRTGNIYSPWPEEINRKLTSSLAAIHFAPTDTAQLNLIREGISPQSIFLTGNTVLDSLYEISQQMEQQSVMQILRNDFAFLQDNRKIILVTGHRRENFGPGFMRICDALLKISELFPEVDIVYPLHLNPNVREKVTARLENIETIYLIPPVNYLAFVYLMKRAYLILTDSGGVQEEAPALQVPVLVMRDDTERPEAVAAGTAKLVGTNIEKIIHHVSELLMNSNNVYQKMSLAQNPYGDGNAAKKIVKILVQLLIDKNITTAPFKVLLNKENTISC